MEQDQCQGQVVSKRGPYVPPQYKTRGQEADAGSRKFVGKGLDAGDLEKALEAVVRSWNGGGGVGGQIPTGAERQGDQMSLAPANSPETGGRGG